MDRKKKDEKITHFAWPDVLVLGGAVVIAAAAISERNWVFLSIGVALAAAIVGRVWLTQWLEKKYLKK